ncbi:MULTISPECIES: DUF3889 domain-containing protein [Bacillaceae]|uniref:DUF3889 domain-containing protein n=1 Tax=Bacillaceae TaxID=186817 RepID=UPI00159BEAD7|nr:MULTISPECIES: DUF3889 domain-containing protein [Bacillaceae]UGB31547.1 YqzG/YhdC family protein [Metabacillus sp. B2-18]
MKKNSLSKLLITFVALFIVLTAGMKAYGEPNPDETDYKKWSQIAVSSVKEKYPDAELTDYKYVGRKEVNENETRDTFHIKCTQKNRSFIVKADVVFNPTNGKLITVNIEELREGGL